MKRKLDRLRLITQDPARKPARVIAEEIGSVVLRRESPRFYFERLLYREESGTVGAYLTPQEAERMYALKKRGDGWLRNLDDKVLFDELMRPSGLPLPQFLGQTRMGSFVSPAGEVRALASAEALASELVAMTEASPTGSVFAKPVMANKGSGAHKVRPETLGKKADDLFAAVSFDDYVFQEAVRQHDGMSALYPHSLNTLRVLVGQHENGEPRVLSVIARMGSGGRSMDNAHAGGVFVGVDVETGTLKTHAHQLFFYGGRRFDRHPDTGVVFGGYSVPLFAEAMDVARRAHVWLPHVYAGWDIGITPDGPVVIECNSGPYILMMDVAHGGLKADPTVRAFLDVHGVEYRD